MICYSFNIIIPNKLKSTNKNHQGSSTLAPAHGTGGASAATLSLLSLPPKKFAMSELVEFAERSSNLFRKRKLRNYNYIVAYFLLKFPEYMLNTNARAAQSAALATRTFFFCGRGGVWGGNGRGI